MIAPFTMPCSVGEAPSMLIALLITPTISTPNKTPIMFPLPPYVTCIITVVIIVFSLILWNKYQSLERFSKKADEE